MNRLNVTRSVLAACAGLVLVGIVGAAQAPKVRITVNTPGRVYFPAPCDVNKSFKKIATLSSRKVFDATTEYKQIARRRLSPNTAEWCLLAKSASDKFRVAVSKTAQTSSYDLIAEAGAITVEGAVVSDITSDVTAQLPTDSN